MSNAPHRKPPALLPLSRLIAVAGIAATLSGPAHSAIAVFEANATTPAGLVATRDGFRAAVGGGNVAGANGDFGGLRREINWDGVPDTFAAPNSLPADFFNVNSPRGAVFSSPTPGATFAVSAKAGLPTAVLFGFPDDLQTFSAERLFATVGSRITDIRFFVPGTTTPATTTAFAAIFVDVDSLDPLEFTVMEFFDPADTLILTRSATRGANQSLSFLGGVANAGELIGRVRITTPDNVLLANGERSNEVNDFVVMDDFLYATPTAVPEPAAWALGLLGLGVLGCKRGHGRSRHAETSR